MADRLHALRLPDTTACGRHGRLIALGDRAALVQGDRLHRIAAEHGAVSCTQCLKRMTRHGLAIDWLDVPAHPASEIAHKRRRRRRRSHA